MRFFIHGPIPPDTQSALLAREHACHAAGELAGDEDSSAKIGAGAIADPRQLLPLLKRKQWNLLTTDGPFVQRLYEQRIAFPGTVILLLDSGAAGGGIDRLFERYPRLAARRLYTITPNRVKIRQLPGAAQA